MSRTARMTADENPAAPDQHARPRLLIADDEPIARAALTAQLGARFTIVGQASGADEAIAIACRHHPDVAVIDVEMPGGGLYATEIIRKVAPETAIAILSIDRQRSSVLRFLAAGANVYLRKGTPAQSLADRLLEVMHCHRYCDAPPRVSRVTLDQRLQAALDEPDLGVVLVTLNGERAGSVLAANAAYAKMLGREPGELLGGNLESWTHPDDLPEGMDDPLVALASGQADSVSFEARYLHRSEYIVWTTATAAAVRDADGTRTAIVRVRDVSADKLAAANSRPHRHRTS